MALEEEATNSLMQLDNTDSSAQLDVQDGFGATGGAESPFDRELKSWESHLMDVFAFSRSVFHFVNDANEYRPVHDDLEDHTSVASGDPEIEHKLEQEEEEKVALLKAQNAAMLARMSALMSNMKGGAPSSEDKERDRQEMQRRRKEEQEKQRAKMLEEKAPREDYGLRLSSLKQWVDERNAKLLKEEGYAQETAVGRVRGFLNAVRMVTRLQTWWRMMRFRLEFAVYRASRNVVKQEYFLAWRRCWKADKMHLYQTLGKPFLAWSQETRDAKSLGIIVREFFAMCIRRLKLTPQAVMVFFAPHESGEEELISQADSMKIRRLILVKLFAGWRSETRELRGRRFKAAQILTRTMRKHKGPLWVKEGVMVCYHVWHRYAAVRSAYKRNEPDPVFKNPHLPQWHTLAQKITMVRIHHKRAQEKGEMLILKRNFRTWRFIMTVDKSKLLTPMAIAINHHTNKVWTKVFGGWSGLLRERGKIVRIRGQCFRAWKLWAPKTKRLTRAERATVQLVQAKRVERAYRVMTAQCFEVVAKRAHALRVLKDNFQNRRLLICAYALSNRDSHVIMLDCWRRWSLWNQSRRRWQASLWQFRHLYHETKMRGIWCAWRDMVREQKQAKLRLVSSVDGALSVQVSHGRSAASSPLTINDADNQSETTEAVSVARSDADWPAAATQHCLRVFHLAQKDGFSSKPDEAAFLLFCRAIVLSGGRPSEVRKRSEEHLHDDASVGESVTMGSHGISHSQSQSQSHYHSAGSRGGSVGSLFHGGKSIQDSVLSEERELRGLGDEEDEEEEEVVGQGGVHEDGGEGGEDGEGPGDDGDGEEEEDDEDENEDEDEDEDDDDKNDGKSNIFNQMSEASVVSGSAGRSLTESVKMLLAQGPPPVDPQKVRQDALQRGVDLMDLRLVALAVEEGAVISTDHVREVANHFGDHATTLFVQLLAGSIDFVSQRVLADDREAFVLQCACPLNALVASIHLRRWQDRDITRREIKLLTQDSILSSTVGSLYAGTPLFRSVVILALKRREDTLRAGLRMLSESRTVEQEVAETMKRNRLARVLQVRRSLTELTGLSGIAGGELYTLNEYLPPPPVVGQAPQRVEPDTSWVKNLNIEQLLYEFTTLVSNVSSEALALRRPQLERDDKLLLNGFLSQSRRDFLALRELTMPAADRARAKEKADDKVEKVEKATKKEAKERRLQEKLYKAMYFAKDLPTITEGSEAAAEEKGGDDEREDGEGEGDGDWKGEDKSEKKGKKAKQGKKSASRGGKRKKGRGDDADLDDDMLEELERADYKDEFHDKLRPFDPAMLLEPGRDPVLAWLRAPEEQRDQEDEVAIYQSRLRSYPTLLFETWRPNGKRKDKEVRITLAATSCKAASMVPRRALALLTMAKDYSQERRAAHVGGFGGWLWRHAVDPSSEFHVEDKHKWPAGYWDIIQMESKLKLDRVVLRTLMKSLQVSIDGTDEAKVALLEQREELEEYLVESRGGLLEIGNKRRAKIANDADLRSGNDRLHLQYTRQIDEIDAQRGAVRAALHKAEALMAEGHFQAAVDLLGGVAGHEPALDEAALAALQQRAADLVQDKAASLAALDEEAHAASAQLELVDREIRSFSRFCYRAESWLRSMAESHFGMMLDAQAVVRRLVMESSRSDRRTAAIFPWAVGCKRNLRENKDMLAFVQREKELYLANLAAADEEERRLRNLPPGMREKSRQRSVREEPATQPQVVEVVDEVSNDDVMSYLLGGKSSNALYDGEVKVEEGGSIVLGEDMSYVVGHEGLQPRTLTVEEEEMILHGTTQEAIEERRVAEAAAAQAEADTEEAERQRLVQEKMRMTEMQRLLEIEQEAMLVMHAMRAKIFDDYWDLIVPMKLPSDARAASRAIPHGSPESSRAPSRAESPGPTTSSRDLIMTDVLETPKNSRMQSRDQQAQTQSQSLQLKQQQEDEPWGRTRRQWIAIGDEHWKSQRGLSTRKQLQDLQQESLAAEGLDLSSGPPLSPAPRPSECLVNEIAWKQIVENVDQSVYMGKGDLEKELERLAEAEGLSISRSAAVTGGWSPPKFGRANRNAVTRTTNMVKASEDPFSAVGKKEIAQFQSSIAHVVASAQKSRSRGEAAGRDAEELEMQQFGFDVLKEFSVSVDLQGGSSESILLGYMQGTFTGEAVELAVVTDDMSESARDTAKADDASSIEQRSHSVEDNSPIVSARSGGRDSRSLSPRSYRQEASPHGSRANTAESAYEVQSLGTEQSPKTPRPISRIVVIAPREEDDSEEADERQVRFQSEVSYSRPDSRSTAVPSLPTTSLPPPSLASRPKRPRKVFIPALSKKRARGMALLGAQASLPEKPRPTADVQSLFLAGAQPFAPQPATARLQRAERRDPGWSDQLRVGDAAMDDVSAPVSLNSLIDALGLGAYLPQTQDGPALAYAPAESLGSAEGQESDVGAGSQASAPSQRSFASLLAMVHAELSDEGLLVEDYREGLGLEREAREGKATSRGIIKLKRPALGSSPAPLEAPSPLPPPSPANLPASQGLGEAEGTSPIEARPQHQAASPRSLHHPPAIVTVFVDRGGRSSPSPSGEGDAFSSGPPQPSASPGTINEIKIVTSMRPKASDDPPAEEPGESERKKGADEEPARPLTPETLALLGEKVKRLMQAQDAYHLSFQVPDFVHFSQATLAKRLRETSARRLETIQQQRARRESDFLHTMRTGTLAIDGVQVEPAAPLLGGAPSRDQSRWTEGNSTRLGPAPQEISQGQDLLDFDEAFGLSLGASTRVGMGSISGSLTATLGASLLPEGLRGPHAASDSALLASLHAPRPLAATGQGYLLPSPSTPQLPFARSAPPSPLQRARDALSTLSPPPSPSHPRTRTLLSSRPASRSLADTARLAELEAVYARLLQDDDGTLEMAYMAALGLGPNAPAPPGEVMLPGADDDMDDSDGGGEDMGEWEEEEEEEEEEEGGGEEKGEGGLYALDISAPDPDAWTNSFSYPTDTLLPSRLVQPGSRPGSGFSLMRISSPTLSPSTGSLRPRPVPAGGLLSPQLRQARPAHPVFARDSLYAARQAGQESPLPPHSTDDLGPLYAQEGAERNQHGGFKRFVPGAAFGAGTTAAGSLGADAGVGMPAGIVGLSIKIGGAAALDAGDSTASGEEKSSLGGLGSLTDTHTLTLAHAHAHTHSDSHSDNLSVLQRSLRDSLPLPSASLERNALVVGKPLSVRYPPYFFASSAQQARDVIAAQTSDLVDARGQPLKAPLSLAGMPAMLGAHAHTHTHTHTGSIITTDSVASLASSGSAQTGLSKGAHKSKARDRQGNSLGPGKMAAQEEKGPPGLVGPSFTLDAAASAMEPDDEAEMEMELRSLLGGGRSAKRLATLMQQPRGDSAREHAFVEAAAGAISLDLPLGRVAQALRQRKAKGARLGKLPPLTAAPELGEEITINVGGALTLAPSKRSYQLKASKHIAMSRSLESLRPKSKQ